MNRRTAISMITTFLGSAIMLFAGIGGSSAQQSDIDKVKSVIDAYHAALSSLDIKKMDELWAHEPYVMAIQPRDKSVAVGWEAVRKGWEGAFSFWSELKVTQKDGPHIHVSGSIAWADGIAIAGGKPKTGDPVAGSPTFEVDVFEKRGDRWLLVSHSAWRLPQ